MKTFFKDFSMESMELVNGGELENVINCRQNQFELTADFIDTQGKIKTYLNKVEELAPERCLHDELSDAILRLECICYSAAYRDGMTDLMAALTLNQLGITKVEYV